MNKNVFDLPGAIRIEGNNNTRSVGGYVVPDPEGRRYVASGIIRSGLLTDLSESDVNYLKNTIRLKKIIDLRTPEEAALEPSLTDIEGVEYKMLDFEIDYDFIETLESPYYADKKRVDIGDYNNHWIWLYYLYGGSVEACIEGMERLYIYAVSQEKSIFNIRRMINELLYNKEPDTVIYHCTVGKDRTGVLFSIILSVLGVDWETIKADYLKTNDFRADYIEEQQKEIAEETNDPEVIKGTYYLMSAQELYLNDMLETINEKYGSMDNFIKDQLGITDYDRKVLRDLYTIKPEPREGE